MYSSMLKFHALVLLLFSFLICCTIERLNLSPKFGVILPVVNRFYLLANFGVFIRF